ncbi:hypothetical protein VDF70_08030 [Xanthomonas campestris pv. raphani]|uniref:hypothetical protein n=1 Tax=Xanthomonas campestris TaxID=339 RepID=UPI002B22B1E3|nr:hypothetical protein [Xanthomonas campestris]MEA9759021.1 hypothetical protein [Xanthomonas campestris pv. raphani]
MRQLISVFSLLLLAGCSCQRTPEPQAANGSPASATVATTAASPVASERPGAVSTATDPKQALASANYAQASATVHRYLGALPGAARADADALWTGGHPAPVPDDAVLRNIGQIISLRINNDPPIALDQQRPPRLIEVPVQLTVRTTSGTERLVGAYRLQPRVGSDTWEIYSATLQPVLR